MDYKRGLRRDTAVIEDYMSDENKKMLEKYLQEKWEDVVLDAVFGTSLDPSSTCATTTHVDCPDDAFKELMKTIEDMPKFVTSLKMSSLTNEVMFGKIMRSEPMNEFERFIGIPIYIDDEMDTGCIEKTYNDGSTETEFLFKIDATTYGIYTLG